MDIAAQALADTELEARRAEITPDRIIAEVSSHFDVTLSELRGRGRSKQIVYPRQIAMYLIRDETGASLVEIGRYLGNRDHSTVMHGISKIEAALESDTHLRRHITGLREKLYGE
jgi:chromosomal replication initiator protein